MATDIKAFGKKAYEFAYRDPKFDKFITILEGAIRTGKTFSFHPKIIFNLCRYKVAGMKVIVGVSKQTVKDNLLNDLFDIIGPANYHYNTQSGELTIFDSKWVVIGAKDEGSEKYLRGKTIGVAIVEEAVLIPESFFMQLLGRLSPKGARLYANTNPDNPNHYLKKKVMDNPEFIKSGDIEVIHFELDDNPNLTKETKERYRRSFTGVFYQRMIQGKWVAAEGAIYASAWLDERNIYSSEPLGLRARGGHVESWISVDCGTDHPQVYLKYYDDGITVRVVEEYVWDSRKEGRQKTNGEYADDLIAFGGNEMLVIVPPETASFKAELTQKGVWYQDADNDVTNGIQDVSSLLLQGKLLIHESCTRLQAGITSYIWDKKAGERGEEQPVKKNDDEVDALRYGIRGKIPAWRITG